MGGGADLCLDGALSAAGEGFRAHRGKFAGMGAAGGVPVSHATGGSRNRFLIEKDLITMTYDSNS